MCHDLSCDQCDAPQAARTRREAKRIRKTAARARQDAPSLGWSSGVALPGLLQRSRAGRLGYRPAAPEARCATGRLSEKRTILLTTATTATPRSARKARAAWEVAGAAREARMRIPPAARARGTERSVMRYLAQDDTRAVASLSTIRSELG